MLISAALAVLAVLLAAAALAGWRMARRRRTTTGDPVPAGSPETEAVPAGAAGVEAAAAGSSEADAVTTGSTGVQAEALAGSLRHAGGQLLGTRETQQDDLGFIAGVTLDPEGHHPAVIVADGMGGHAAGDVASRLAVREFMEAYGVEGRPSDRLRAALDRANRALGEAIAEDPGLRGMGTTLVAAAVTSNGLEWISVGDSALLLHRDGRLKKLNEDHSMRPVIAALREVDPQAADSMSPHQLRSALVGSDIARIDASAMPELLMPGDLVLAVTDGMDTLDDLETAAIIADHRTDGPAAIRDALLEAVANRRKPTQDNATIAIVEAAAGEQGESV